MSDETKDVFAAPEAEQAQEVAQDLTPDQQIEAANGHFKEALGVDYVVGGKTALDHANADHYTDAEKEQFAEQINASARAFEAQIALEAEKTGTDIEKLRNDPEQRQKFAEKLNEVINDKWGDEHTVTEEFARENAALNEYAETLEKDLQRLNAQKNRDTTAPDLSGKIEENELGRDTDAPTVDGEEKAGEQEKVAAEGKEGEETQADEQAKEPENIVIKQDGHTITRVGGAVVVYNHATDEPVIMLDSEQTQQVINDLQEIRDDEGRDDTTDKQKEVLDKLELDNPDKLAAFTALAKTSATLRDAFEIPDPSSPANEKDFEARIKELKEQHFSEKEDPLAQEQGKEEAVDPLAPTTPEVAANEREQEQAKDNDKEQEPLPPGRRAGYMGAGAVAGAAATNTDGTTTEEPENEARVADTPAQKEPAVTTTEPTAPEANAAPEVPEAETPEQAAGGVAGALGEVGEAVLNPEEVVRETPTAATDEPSQKSPETGTTTVTENEWIGKPFADIEAGLVGNAASTTDEQSFDTPAAQPVQPHESDLVLDGQETQTVTQGMQNQPNMPGSIPEAVGYTTDINSTEQTVTATAGLSPNGFAGDNFDLGSPGISDTHLGDGAITVSNSVGIDSQQTAFNSSSFNGADSVTGTTIDDVANVSLPEQRPLGDVIKDIGGDIADAVGLLHRDSHQIVANTGTQIDDSVNHVPGTAVDGVEAKVETKTGIPGTG